MVQIEKLTNFQNCSNLENQNFAKKIVNFDIVRSFDILHYSPLF